MNYICMHKKFKQKKLITENFHTTYQHTVYEYLFVVCDNYYTFRPEQVIEYAN